MFLTSQFCTGASDFRVMLASGAYARIDNISAFLWDVPLSRDARAMEFRYRRAICCDRTVSSFSRLRWLWSETKRIATEMVEQGVTDGDLSFMIFFVVLEEGRR